MNDQIQRNPFLIGEIQPFKSTKDQELPNTLPEKKSLDQVVGDALSALSTCDQKSFEQGVKEAISHLVPSDHKAFYQILGNSLSTLSIFDPKSFDHGVEDAVASLVKEGHIKEVREGLYKSIDKA